MKRIWRLTMAKNRGFSSEKNQWPVCLDRSSSRPVVHLGWKRGRGVETRRPPHEEATVGTSGISHSATWRIIRLIWVFFPWIFQHAMFESLIFSSMPCFAPSKSLGGLRCWHLTPRSECLGPGKSWEDRIWMDMGHMGMVKKQWRAYVALVTLVNTIKWLP